MQHLNSIQLHNLVVYDDATFYFERGTHMVRGENGTGKSLLFTPIANLLYSTPPMLSKANQAGKFLTAGSATTLDWHNADHHWNITQRAKGASVGYDILQDGDPLDPKRIGVARERIAEAWPLSAQQFYTFVYLNAFRPNLLLQGSDSDRRSFFEELYVLHRYEQIREALSEEASKIKEGASTHNYLERQLRDLRRHRWPTDLARRRHRLEERVVRVGQELSELNRHLQTVAARAALERNLTLRLGPELTDTRLAEIRRRVKRLRADEERWRAAERARSVNDSIRERRTAVKRRLKDLGKTRSLKKLERALDRSKDLLGSLKEQHALWTELRPVVKAARAAGQPQHDAKTLRRMQAQLEADLERAESILHKFHRLKGHKACPLCGGRLKSKQVARVIAEQEAVRKAARKTQGLIDSDTERLELADRAASFPADYDPQRHQALVEAHRELVDELKRARVAENLQAALADLPRPQRTGDEDLTDPREALRKAERAELALRRDRVLYRQLAEQPVADTGNLDALNAQAERLQRRLERLNSYLFKVTGAVSDARANAQQVEKTEREFRRYDRQAQLMPVYDALLGAYGARGLKMEHLTHLLRGYEENLNEYAGLIYPKPIRFRVEASASGFRIVAIRNRVESDINLLSGSESRCFTLLSLLSLLPYLPEQYRCNTLILDEMESGMSPRSKAMFCNTFLPHLAQQVECLVLVTPQPPSELYVANSNEYQVVRGRGANSKVSSELRRL